MPPRPISPEGAAEGLIRSRVPVAPLGLTSQCGTAPRGLRPWLNTFAPAGAICRGAFGELRPIHLAVGDPLPRSHELQIYRVQECGQDGWHDVTAGRFLVD